MTSDERSNDFFGHLDQPVPPTPRKMERPEDADYEVVPDPFGPTNAPPKPPTGNVPRPAQRPPTGESPQVPPAKGPGLSPGIPRVNQPPKHEAPRSGVVLTPGGVKRVDQTPSGPTPQRPPSGQAPQRPASGQSPQRKTPSGPAPAQPQAPEFHEASRQRNDADDVSWEEYAASDFPAMAAEEFGVKTKTSDSGRVVPVAVRADLTDEAIKDKSIKGKGRAPRPITQEAQRPRSFMQRISDSLRRKEAQESEDAEDGEGQTKGFAKSGSQPVRKKRKGPLAVAWNVVVEVCKILLLVLLLRAYVVQVSEVTGPSMKPTLEEKDRLVVERITPLFSGHQNDWWTRVLPDAVKPTLERGNLVVVRSPEDPGLELVKRLIALPGDTIKFEGGSLYIKPAGSGEFEKVNEDYLQVDDLKNPDGSFRSYLASDLGGYLHEGQELVVPPHRLFIMGDNRGRSNDSRRWLNIEVPVTETPGVDRLWVHTTSVEGVVVFRLWPFDRIWPPVK